MECYEKHGRDDFYTYLTECQSANPVAVLVHSDCRRNLTDKKGQDLKAMLQMVLELQAQRDYGPVQLLQLEGCLSSV